MKRVRILVVALVILVLASTIASADSGPGWSEPVEIDRNEGEAYLEDPELLAHREALWAAFSRYPGLVIGRMEGQDWDLSDPIELGEAYLSNPRPVSVIEHELADKAIRLFARLSKDHGAEQYLYGFTQLYHQDLGFGGGSYWRIPFSYYAFSRYDVLFSEDAYHLIWRNFYGGVVSYSRRDETGYGWTSPVTVTAEFPEGGAPALWVDGDRIVVIVDDTTDDGYHHYQSWAFLSEDGGETWSGKIYVGEGAYPRIAQRGDELVVLLRGGSSNKLMSFVSSDFGNSWEGPYYLPTGAYPSLGALAAFPSGWLAAAWYEDHNIHVSFSKDGQVWETELVYSSDAVSVRPDVAFWNGRVYVVWKENAFGGEPERIFISGREMPRYKLFLPLVARR